MKVICALAALAAIAAAPAYADCTAPAAPQNIPDGNTATMQQMLEGQKAVQAYNSATNAYLDCLSSDHKTALQAAGPKASDDQKAKLDQIETTKHNAAVDQLKSVVDNFNEQIRIFKAKGSKSG
jgi:predicted dinucleotide-binding enzyme